MGISHTCPGIFLTGYSLTPKRASEHLTAACFKAFVLPSRPAAFLYLAFIQLGNTHLITIIYVQTGLLKNKWIKSWSGKRIKLYCGATQPAYLGCDVMQAMGILLCKSHWEFKVAAQPAQLPVTHLADGRDPQPHPSTFDLMFQSFLPSLNSHLTTAEAQCISADGSKQLSELTRVGAAHTHLQAAKEYTQSHLH